MAAGAANAAEFDLVGAGVVGAVGIEKVVDGSVGRNPGKPVGEFKALVAHPLARPDAGRAQRSLVDKLQGKARLDCIMRLARPPHEAFPCAKDTELGDQQPQAEQ